MPERLSALARPPGIRPWSGSRARRCDAASPGRACGADVAVRGSQADLGLLFRGSPPEFGLPPFGQDLARWAGTHATGVRARGGWSGAGRRGERHPPLVLLAEPQAM